MRVFRVVKARATSHMACAPARDERRRLLQSTGRCPAVATVDTGIVARAELELLKTARAGTYPASPCPDSVSTQLPDPRKLQSSRCESPAASCTSTSQFIAAIDDTLCFGCNLDIVAPPADCQRWFVSHLVFVTILAYYPEYFSWLFWTECSVKLLSPLRDP